MSDIDVTIGTANIVLRGHETTSYDDAGTTVTFIFADALMALSYVADAVLPERHRDDVQQLIQRIIERFR